MDPRIHSYVIRSSFYGLYRIGHVTLDWGLITSLVERWRPETHTFHLLVGERTSTLHDVAIILGLRTHRPPVTGTCDFNVSLLCQELLDVIPPLVELRGFVILTRWLSQQLSAPPIDTNEMTLERSARGFI